MPVSGVAGWFPDPYDPSNLRWWDGREFTTLVRPLDVTTVNDRVESAPPATDPTYDHSAAPTVVLPVPPPGVPPVPPPGVPGAASPQRSAAPWIAAAVLVAVLAGVGGFFVLRDDGGRDVDEVSTGRSTSGSPFDRAGPSGEAPADEEESPDEELPDEELPEAERGSRDDSAGGEPPAPETTTESPVLPPPSLTTPSVAPPIEPPADVVGTVVRTCGQGGGGDCFVSRRIDPTSNQPAVGRIDEGETVMVSCQVAGESVTSSVLGVPTSVWIRDVNGRYMSAAFVDVDGWDPFTITRPC